MPDTDSLSLSPSRVHQRLMKQTRPRLGYPGPGGDLAAWQAQLRAAFANALGMDQMPAEPCPLNVHTLRTIEHDLGRIEKLVFTSEQGADVPAYLCVPAQPRATPTPVFICLQGHSTGMHQSIGRACADEDTPITKEGDRDFGLQCMARGIVALCIEQRGFGERKEAEFGTTTGTTTCGCAVSHALMLGRTLAGERVYDTQRGIDLLHELVNTREGLAFDFHRLGLMGNSGGGTITLFTAALDDRVKLAMPSCYFCTWAASIMSLYHCPDNHIPGAFLLCENADIAGLIAPRPMVVVNGKDDDIFPIDAARDAFVDLRKIYDAAGAPDRVHHVIGQGGHRFYADDAWPIMERYLG